MNTSHYPTLELCKKLEEIGFPDTNKHFVCHEAGYYIEGQYGTIPSAPISDRIVCPSVMEMLDVIPHVMYIQSSGRLECTINSHTLLKLNLSTPLSEQDLKPLYELMLSLKK